MEDGCARGFRSASVRAPLVASATTTPELELGTSNWQARGNAATESHRPGARLPGGGDHDGQCYPGHLSARIATLTELFKAKSLVSAVRSKTRDWIDLYLLLRKHGFTLRDYREAFQEAGIGSQFEIGLSRLCSGIPQKDDKATHIFFRTHPPARR